MKAGKSQPGDKSYHCPRCGRNPKVIICECVSPTEDENVLSLLCYMAEDIRLRPEKRDEITDKTCVAITAYIRGRESMRDYFDGVKMIERIKRYSKEGP